MTHAVCREVDSLSASKRTGTNVSRDASPFPPASFDVVPLARYFPSAFKSRIKVLAAANSERRCGSRK